MSTVSQPLIAVGDTQASSVMPVVRSREAASATVTQLLTPPNDRALPYFPLVVQVAPETVPLFPLPEASAATVPAPSLKPYAATKPVAELATVTVIAVEVVVWPAASRARADRVYEPLATAVVFQLIE